MPESRERFRQIDGLFDAALDLPPDERDAFLNVSCGVDVALRDRVRTLIDAHERSSDFLQSPAVELAAVLLADASATPRAPERVGPFRIIRELGAGGMGVVYLAEREGAEFQQRVALKLVRHLGPGEAVLRRFVEERRILALLEHPRIAHLIDGGLTPDGLPYFAMELVEGEPLDSYCDNHNLSIEQRIELFVDVCDAVQYAHEHLVVHRDLKPSNILVRGDGQLKLLDFGIAKLLDPLQSGDADPTQTGIVALTPEYAAPEQVRGLPVNTATDTYALGVVLYRLLTGERPYDVRGRTPAEVERIVCEIEPPRPSAVAPERVRRRLRGDLDVIVMKALHKEPARRYSSASSLRDDLRRYRTGLPVLARPDSTAYRLRKFVRRNRAGVAATGITVIALAGATAFSTSQAREAQRQRDAALQEVQRQRSMVEVQTILASDPRDAQGRPLPFAQRIELASKVLAEQFASQPWLIVEGMSELADRLYENGDREAERAMLERARTVAQQSNLPLQLALVRCSTALSLAFDEQIDSARAALAEAKRALATPGPRDEAVGAACLRAEGELLMWNDQLDSAIVVFKQALEVGDRGRLGRQSTLLGLASALRAAGQTREATTYQRQTVVELESTGYRGTDFFENTISQLNPALSELGEIATADSIIRAALRAQASLPGGYTSGVLDFLHGLAKLRMGELDSADYWIARSTQHKGEADAGLSVFLPPAITQLRLEQGRLPDARAALATLPTGTLVRRVNRAWFSSALRHAEGDVRGASAMLADSLRAIGEGSAKPPPSFAIPLVTLAEWRLGSGDAHGADSLALLARTAAAIDSLALSRSGYVGRAELVRARARRALGDVSGARDAANRAVAALATGYGPANRRTSDARALLAALSK